VFDWERFVEFPSISRVYGVPCQHQWLIWTRTPFRDNNSEPLNVRMADDLAGTQSALSHALPSDRSERQPLYSAAVIVDLVKSAGSAL